MSEQQDFRKLAARAAYNLMTGGIYRIRNLVNGKVYVGSAKDLESRKGDHFYDLQRGGHRNPHLQRSYNKHGANAFVFEVIENLGEYDKDIYFARENIFIDLARETGMCYNIAKAEGGWTYHTEERKDEIRAKVSEGLKSYFSSLTEEQRKELNKHKLGTTLSDAEKKYLSDLWTGVPKREETKQRMSEAQKARPLEDKQAAGRRVGMSNKGKLPPNTRKVLVDDMEFVSMKAAAEYLNTCSAVLCGAIKRRAQGKKFRKIHDVRYSD